MTGARVVGWWVALGLSGLVAGCAAGTASRTPVAGAASPTRECRVGVLTPEALKRAAPRWVRQRVTIVPADNGDAQTFESVLQVHCGELTLVGLTPMGTKAFVLRHDGRSLDADFIAVDEPPFDPKFIIRDVVATLLSEDAPVDERPAVREHSCGEGDSGPVVRVTYPLGWPRGPRAPDSVATWAPVAPPSVELRHGAYAYTVRAVTLDGGPLEGGCSVEGAPSSD